MVFSSSPFSISDDIKRGILFEKNIVKQYYSTVGDHFLRRYPLQECQRKSPMGIHSFPFSRRNEKILPGNRDEMMNCDFS